MPKFLIDMKFNITRPIRAILMMALLLHAVSSCTGDYEDSSGVSNGSYTTILTVGDFLYRVSTTEIATFDLSDPDSPQLVDTRDVGFEIESLFHRTGVLFIGSSTAMHIFTIDSAGIPQRTSETTYRNFDIELNSCDPIVTDDQYAFVTLSTTVDAGRCNRSTPVNELRIYDITDLESPLFIENYRMSQPKGLALDGDLLFICDGFDGLRIYDRSDVTALELLYHFQGFATFDAIARNGLLLVVGPDNIYQYDYKDRDNIVALQTIEL